MALDYRYVVGRKHLRDSKKHNVNEMPTTKKSVVILRVKATGAEGMSEISGDFNLLPPEHPVTISFGCHGQKKYIRSALEVVSHV